MKEREEDRKHLGKIYTNCRGDGMKEKKRKPINKRFVVKLVVILLSTSLMFGSVLSNIFTSESVTANTGNSLHNLKDEIEKLMGGKTFFPTDDLPTQVRYRLRDYFQSLIPDSAFNGVVYICLLYTSPSPRDRQKSRMPSSA